MRQIKEENRERQRNKGVKIQRKRGGKRERQRMWREEEKGEGGVWKTHFITISLASIILFTQQQWRVSLC